ncbi:S16 family serine protease [Vibrio sinaloensis]|uniref:S16 family serine protease n=1 Tax=Photobacterium sp. (strain ATCC 43367) TaxID=379097 RepID=UPI00204E3528|nr:Lon protease family protein [Vibrio sinaloensis]UPQ86785.1 Lon protease family protein [Vibrio sinaloensis]
MNQESWHAVTPQYSHYDAQIQRFDTLEPVDFFDIQPRFKHALSTFCALEGLSRLLIVNSIDNSFYRQLIVDGLSRFSGDKPVYTTESLNIATLVGSYTCNERGDIVTSSSGLLDKADGGFLVIPVTLLLANPASWQVLKSVLLGQEVNPINANPQRIATNPPTKRYTIKIVIAGDRHQLADFEYIEPEAHSGLALFCEIENEVALSANNIESYLGFVAWIVKTHRLPTLSFGALHRLMIAGARYTEDQHYMPIELLWYLALFQEAKLSSNGKVLSEQDIEIALENRYFRESYLPERALADITDGQVIIETTGECVGQVNGLTVIDVPGHPMSYGEPARISCVIHFGDGDISDVERKAELGGNLHAKGMMIMQAFVSSALQLDEPLPYSASVVFEQSYSEVDGDSATLAELCSFVSALSEYPINQQIAVTGAVDQFGRVQAVGGLNEKIEGFYHVCKHQGLTGNQGVILPKTNLKHLALNKDVVESIKNNQFHIWSVSTVDEAVPILMGKPFRGDDEESVISKIAQRIENFERHEHPQGIVERIKNWFA